MSKKPSSSASAEEEEAFQAPSPSQHEALQDRPARGKPRRPVRESLCDPLVMKIRVTPAFASGLKQTLRTVKVLPLQNLNSAKEARDEKGAKEARQHT